MSSLLAFFFFFGASGISISRSPLSRSLVSPFNLRPPFFRYTCTVNVLRTVHYHHSFPSLFIHWSLSRVVHCFHCFSAITVHSLCNSMAVTLTLLSPYSTITPQVTTHDFHQFYRPTDSNAHSPSLFDWHPRNQRPSFVTSTREIYRYLLLMVTFEILRPESIFW